MPGIRLAFIHYPLQENAEADLLPPDPQPAKAGAAALNSTASAEAQDPILHLRFINNSSNVIMVESVELVSGPLEVADPATYPTETPAPSASPTDVAPTQTDVQPTQTGAPTQTAKPTEVPTFAPAPTTKPTAEPTVTFGSTPTSGPPSQPKGRPVLHVELYQPSTVPGGGKVFYTYKWTSDGGDNPIIHGPIQATEDLVREGDEGATFNPGETWTVMVIPQNEKGESGPSYSGSFFFTAEGNVVFQGWIVR